MGSQSGFQALLSFLEERPRNNPHDRLVRHVVQLRARDVCEYCLRQTGAPFEIDHIIPPDRWDDYIHNRIVGRPPVPDRRGPDHLDNFAWSCPFCNRSKSQYVTASLYGQPYPLFDPRYDDWQSHFGFRRAYVTIRGHTLVGVATQQKLDFNGGGGDGPLATRHEDIGADHYPPLWARAWII